MLKGGFYSPYKNGWDKKDRRDNNAEITGSVTADGRFDFRRGIPKINEDEDIFVIEKGDLNTVYVGWQEIGKGEKKYIFKLPKQRKGRVLPKIEILYLDPREVCNHQLDHIAYVDLKKNKDLISVNDMRKLILRNLYFFNKERAVDEKMILDNQELEDLYNITKNISQISGPPEFESFDYGLPISEVEADKELFIIEKGDARTVYIGWQKIGFWSDDRKYMLKITKPKKQPADKTVEIVLTSPEEVCNNPLDLVSYINDPERICTKNADEIRMIISRNYDNFAGGKNVDISTLESEEDGKSLRNIANRVLNFMEI